jgi:hypothetical protein
MSETDYDFYDDEKKVYIMMINNSSNILSQWVWVSAIVVLFNTKEFHQMAEPVKIKIVMFQRLCDYAIGYLKR